LENEAENVKIYSETFPGEENAVNYVRVYAEKEKTKAQYITMSGEITASSDINEVGKNISSQDIIEAVNTENIAWWKGETSETKSKELSVSIPIRNEEEKIIGIIRLKTDLAEISQKAAQSVIIAMIPCVLSICVVISINIFYNKIIIKPIEMIRNVVLQIANGGYGATIERDSFQYELNDIAESINKLSTSIAKAEKTEVEFLGTISHELRTPLTAITGWSETLLFGDITQDTKTGLEIIRRESMRLNQMVEELLEYTRMEDGRFTLDIKKFDLVDELEDALMTFREMLPENELQLRYLPCEDFIPKINGDPNRLRQVFLNLFDNALKYAQDGKRIDVTIQKREKNAAVIIRDFGNGVPEHELKYLKTKFYKASNARGRGSGIGLAVCDEIIKYHGGELILENVYGNRTDKPEGFRCTITLPLTESKSEKHK